MTSDDREVLLLLATEVERHLVRLDQPRPIADIRVVLHTLKGSAGLARQHDLALVIAQLSARIKQGDDSVPGELRTLLEQILPPLRQGKAAFDTTWPEPPPGLKASPIDPSFRADYLSAMQDRLGELDAALDGTTSGEALDLVYRTAHAMKGVAASAGDSPTAWYCHGLETCLKKLRSNAPGNAAVLPELVRHRAIISELLDHPERALHSLSALARRPATARRTSVAPSETPPGPTEVALRVSPRFVERLVERVERVDLARDELLRLSQANRQAATQLRDLRSQLLESTRRIGPAKPWGPPAQALQNLEALARSLGEVAASNYDLAITTRNSAETLRSAGAALRDDLATQRTTTLEWVFDRLDHSVKNLATEDQEVQLFTAGADLEIDRRTADLLLEPLLQLTRNAVAHGIESRSERRQVGKAEAGVIRLRGERIGDWIRISVEDDGRGVDVRRIREMAAERAALSDDALRSASDNDLLNLLFLPGLTTREVPDLLAGRGVGLDLAQSNVRRLGGAIRLASTLGSGLCAIVEVPAERVSVNVLWLSTAGAEFALPVTYAGRVGPLETFPDSTSLARCLSLPGPSNPRFAVEVTILGVHPVALSVDSVGTIEEALIRSVPPLISARGPYSGAILRSDGSLRLVLDGALLAARAWASFS